MSRSGILRVGLVSLAVTLGLTLAVCLSPLRFDAKALGPTLPRTTEGSIQPGSSVLLVSADNAGGAGHVARYGLDLIAFPSGETAWLAFHEGYVAGPWPPDALIDGGGELLLPAGAAGWRPVDERPAVVDRILTTGIVLIPSGETRSRLLARWPWLDASRIRILDTNRPALVERPRLRVSIGDLLRLGAFVFVVAGAVVVGTRLAQSQGLAWLGASVALPSLVAVHCAVVLVAGHITSRPFPWVLGLEVLALLLWLGRLPPEALPLDASLRVPAAVAACLYLAVVLVRLDFDGDLFTHWLPMARSHLLLGRHDPAWLLGRYGLAHEATYPPGFPALISTLLWIAGTDPRASLQLGDDAHMAVVLYRLLMAALLLSVLLAAVALMHALTVERSAALLPLVGIPPLIPAFLGQPSAAEVYLVPLAGAAMLAFWAGGVFRSASWAGMGLFLSAFLLTVKREAVLAVPLVVLPWAVGCTWRAGRERLTQAALLGLGLAPFLLWRAQMAGLDLRENFMFDDLGSGRLNGAVLARLTTQGARVVLADPSWIVLLLALPLASLACIRLRHWRLLPVPAGILVYAGGMLLSYAFSRSDPAFHLATSYGRVLMVAVLSACLFGMRVLAEALPTDDDS